MNFAGNISRLMRMPLLFVAVLVAPWTVGATTSPFMQSFDPSRTRITLSPTDRWGVFRESDSIIVGTVSNASVRVVTLDGTQVYQGAPGSLSLPRGHYFVETAGDRTQFTVLPDDYTGSPMLGVHGSSLWNVTAQMNQVQQPQWERVAEGSWEKVQAQAGQWDWSGLDNAMTQLAGSTRKVIFVGADRIPSWVATTNIVSAYTTFATAALNRYGTRIHAWEVWNEPWFDKFRGTNWSDTVRVYMDLARASKSVRDQLTPSVKLLGPSWCSESAGLETQAMIQDGLLDILDYWSFHDYGMRSYAPDQTYTGLSQPIHRRLPAAFGATAAAKPLIIGEMGFYGMSELGLNISNATDDVETRSGLAWTRGFYRTVKATVMYRAVGAVCIIPHLAGFFAEYPDSNWEIYGWEESAPASSGQYSPRGPHPKTSGFLMANYWLNNATLAGYRSLADRVFLYAWQRPTGEAIVFAWALEGQTVAVVANHGLTTTDVYGSPFNITSLTEEPVAFHSTAQNAGTLLNSVLNTLAENINTPPAISPVSTQTVQKEQPLQFTVLAADVDNDPVTFSMAPLPAGASFDAATGTFHWTPATDQAGTYPITATATDARGASSSVSTTIIVLHDPNDGLVVSWKLDDATGKVATDSIGSNDGTLSSGFASTTGWVDGKVSTALNFDGYDDYVTFNGAPLAFANNFTISAWVYPKRSTGSGCYFALGAQDQVSGIDCFVSGKTLLVQGRTPAGWQKAYFYTGAIADNTWYHLVVVYDRSTLRAYVNGQLQGSATWGGDILYNTAVASRLGTDTLSYFVGYLDEITLFSRPLSDTEVQDLYQPTSTPPPPPPPVTNRAPVLAAIGNKSATLRQTLTFTVNAADADGNALAYSASSLPAGATFSTGTRQFSWKPSLTQAGNYSVTFSATDGTASDSETIAVSVTGTNRAPVFSAIGSRSVRAGQRLSFTANATDADGDAITYSASGLPSGAKFDAAKRIFMWTPTVGQAGKYTITLSATDGALTGKTTVTVNVTSTAITRKSGSTARTSLNN